MKQLLCTIICRFMNGRVPPNKRYQPTEYEHAANCATHATKTLITISSFGSGNIFLQDPSVESLQLKVNETLISLVSLYIFAAKSSCCFFCLFVLNRLNLRELGPWACHMRWLVWVMASFGTTYVFFFHERYKLMELICYSVMGVFPALVILSMPEQSGLCELLVGGACYCLGIVFFKSDGIVPFAHAIWHMFVAMGAAIHYYAIWKYLYAQPPNQVHTSR
uniref:Monocyte to macrophage differentiation associated 2 n=1 Tax=Amphilophus citrinellus TaxID=61819 RepID=A0A3Q0SI36_AMPCI